MSAVREKQNFQNKLGGGNGLLPVSPQLAMQACYSTTKGVAHSTAAPASTLDKITAIYGV